MDDDLNNVQADIQPLRNTLEANHHIEALHNYDSLLGYTEHLNIQDSLYVLPVGNAREVLRRAVHILVLVEMEDVSFCVCHQKLH